MATLKDHQQAMVDLLASGSGIPASASRLAHAMHDVLSAILAEPDLIAKAIQESKAIRQAYTTPGLNDKALCKREKTLKTNSPAKWPTPAEQRVKELENTIRQLKANNAKLKAERDDMTLSYNAAMTELRQLRCDHDFKYRSGTPASHCLKCGAESLPEQSGCRKEDTQAREPEWMSWSGGECPLPADTIVEVKFYDRQTESGSKASAYVWRHGALGVRELDIIAYRVIPK